MLSAGFTKNSSPQTACAKTFNVRDLTKDLCECLQLKTHARSSVRRIYSAKAKTATFDCYAQNDVMDDMPWDENEEFDAENAAAYRKGECSQLAQACTASSESFRRKGGCK